MAGPGQQEAPSTRIGGFQVQVFDFRGLKAITEGQAHACDASRDAYRTIEGMEYATLNTGQKMPLVGLGTWKAEPGQVEAAVEAAVRAGYRHIDCAAIYANEKEVGRALARVLAEGVVTREQLFVTTKLWNSDHGRVEAACRRSLRDLQLSYIDLYLIHWPVSGNSGAEVQPPLAATWAAMEALHETSLARAIGVSNLSAAKLGRLLQGCRVRPAVNQVEAHPYFRNERLLQFCAQQGVHVTAYSPLGSPDSAGMFKRQAPALLQEPLLLQLAAKYGKSTGQVLIRWGVQRGTSVLPKSTNPARIRANIEVFDWSLGREDFDRLSALATQQRMVDGSFWLSPGGPYRTLRDLWDE